MSATSTAFDGSPSGTLQTSSTSRTTATVALTTTFTPPPPCSTAFISPIQRNSNSKIIGFAEPYYYLAGIASNYVFPKSCYPSSWTLSAVFSPGICPSGYASGYMSTGTASGTASAETGAICCPTNWFCQTDQSTFIGDVAYTQPWITDYPCVSYPPATETITAWVYTQAYRTTGISINAPGLQVRWRERDFASSTASPGRSVVSTVNSPPTSTPENSGLSSAAKAGIGVGVGVGMTFMAGIFGLEFWQLRRKRFKDSLTDKKSDQSASEAGGFAKPELDSSPAEPTPELGGIGPRRELDSREKAELGGTETNTELDGSKPARNELDAVTPRVEPRQVYELP